MECKIIREILPAYQDGEVTEAESSYVEEHLQICHSCKNVGVELRDAWHMLETWEDSDPPEKIRKDVLTQIARQQKVRWIKIMIPVAAALLIVMSLTFRFTVLWQEKQHSMPLPVVPIQLSAEHPDFDENELIADLHVLQDEDFYDTVEELEKIDYLPLIDDTKQIEGDRQRSSLNVAMT